MSKDNDSETRAAMNVCPECGAHHVWTRKGPSWELFSGCETPGVEPTRYNGEYNEEEEPC
jgi:hypothetical protein